MSVRMLEVVWDDDGTEITLFMNLEGDYVISVNGQGHIPLSSGKNANIVGFLRDLADRIEKGQ